MSLTGIHAGDVLRGKVIATVNNTEYLRPGNCTLHLSMTGKEKVHSHPKIRFREHQFFLVNLRLQHPEWARQIRMTTYVLPFAIQLPHSLPSTDYELQGEVGYRIQYKLQVMAGVGNKEDILVNVSSAPLPDERVPCVVEPRSYAIHSLKLFQKGQLVIAARVEDTHVGKGQNVCLHVACQNDSTVDVHDVRISLMEHVFYGAGRAGASMSHPNQTRTLFTLEHVNLPGLDREGKSRGQVRQNNENRQETYKMLHKELASGRNRILIKLPWVSDTYNGRIVKVIHSLVIYMKTPDNTTDPSISIPIRIGTAPLQIQAAQPSETAIPSAPPENLVFAPAFGIESERIRGVTASAATVIPSAPPESFVFAPTLGFESGRVPTIPIAEAVSIPFDASVSAVFNASDDVIFLGDDAVFQDSPIGEDQEEHLSGRAPLSALSQSTPAMETLHHEMLASIGDYDIISEHLQNDAWRELLANLSPEEFGSTIACVHVDFDQPRVAFLLASCRPDFSCAHLAAALRNTAEWTRTNMVHKLLPCCSDVVANEALVLDELNEWERVVTEEDFSKRLVELLCRDL